MRTSLFRTHDKVLLVGEGNFSFAVSLHKLNLNIKLTATCYESPVTFESGIRSADYLKKHGVRVLLGVDGTKLEKHFSSGVEDFDVIIFNFPHVGGKMKIDKNRILLKDFFVSAENFIKSVDGFVCVSLCNGQGGTDADNPRRRWDDSWQIVEMAAHGNFLLTDVEPFLFENFPNYGSVGYRNLEKSFGIKNSLVHIFKKTQKPDPFNIMAKVCLKSENQTQFGDIDWKKMVAGLSENDIRDSRPLSIHPLSFSFHVTFSTDRNFVEMKFYEILYRFAGNVVDDVKFLGTYKFPGSSERVTRTYEITYRSLRFPLFRSRVIEIHKDIVTKILEHHLNVVVTK